MKLFTLAVVSLFLLWGCGDKPVDSKPAASKNGVSLPADIFVAKHKDAISILAARKLKPGDEVTLSGKVMGKDKVFIDGRALMILGDPSTLTSCDLKPGDGCKSPWDVCCDADKAIKDGTLSVQVIDKTGKPLKIGLKGQGGLKELSEVTVKGVVAADSTADSMTINIESIFVKK